MIDVKDIAVAVNEAIENTDVFVVEITVSKDNDIVVELDSPTGVDLDFCSEVSRKLNEKFDRDVEDYSLEVGSASLTAPFKVPGQWLKNIGNEIEVFTLQGKKLVGTLTAYTPESVTLESPQKVKKEGEKRPRIETVAMTIPLKEIRQAQYHIDFKRLFNNKC